MKKKVTIIFVLIILITIASIIIDLLGSKNPSDEELGEIVAKHDQIIDSLEEVIAGEENPSPDYQISIEDARKKAIIIFTKLGENDLNKDNVFVQEFVKAGKKHYLISSAKNTVLIEISTGKVVMINNNIQ